LTIVLVGWLVPETKGRSLEEITAFWTHGQTRHRGLPVEEEELAVSGKKR